MFDWFSRVFRKPVQNPPLSTNREQSPKVDTMPAPAKLPIGLRLNNPTNLRPLPRGQLWRGQSGVESGFCRFWTPEDGLRAGALNLRNQKVLHRIDTIRALISKYAPPSENDTESYIRAMCTYTGFGDSEVIDLQDADTLLLFLRGVIRHEQGRQPFPPFMIEAAVDAALKA
jgi:hypothetical protein